MISLRMEPSTTCLLLFQNSLTTGGWVISQSTVSANFNTPLFQQLMCDYSKGLKLCKCENEKIQFRAKDDYRFVNGEVKLVPNKKNENIPLIFIWQLFRYAGKCETSEMGRYLFPGNDLGNSLNSEWIELNLNLTNCFDFEYIPNEGDNLIIRRNIKFGDYISFIFKDRAWTVSHYSPFEDEREKIFQGKLKTPE